jgi:hypothetical protein
VENCPLFIISFTATKKSAPFMRADFFVFGAFGGGVRALSPLRFAVGTATGHLFNWGCALGPERRGTGVYFKMHP